MAICAFCDQEMTDTLTGSCQMKWLSYFIDGIHRKRVPYHTDEPLGAPGYLCHDCNVAPGGYHHPNCDAEACPKCGGQIISCGCYAPGYDLEQWRWQEGKMIHFAPYIGLKSKAHEETPKEPLVAQEFGQEFKELMSEPPFFLGKVQEPAPIRVKVGDLYVKIEVEPGPSINALAELELCSKEAQRLAEERDKKHEETVKAWQYAQGLETTLDKTRAELETLKENYEYLKRKAKELDRNLEDARTELEKANNIISNLQARDMRALQPEPGYVVPILSQATLGGMAQIMAEELKQVIAWAKSCRDVIKIASERKDAKEIYSDNLIKANSLLKALETVREISLSQTPLEPAKSPFTERQIDLLSQGLAQLRSLHPVYRMDFSLVELDACQEALDYLSEREPVASLVEPKALTPEQWRQLHDLASHGYSTISIVFWRKSPEYADSEALHKAHELLNLIKSLGGIQ